MSLLFNQISEDTLKNNQIIFCQNIEYIFLAEVVRDTVQSQQNNNKNIIALDIAKEEVQSNKDLYSTQKELSFMVGLPLFSFLNPFSNGETSVPIEAEVSFSTKKDIQHYKSLASQISKTMKTQKTHNILLLYNFDNIDNSNLIDICEAVLKENKKTKIIILTSRRIEIPEIQQYDLFHIDCACISNSLVEQLDKYLGENAESLNIYLTNLLFGTGSVSKYSLLDNIEFFKTLTTSQTLNHFSNNEYIPYFIQNITDNEKQLINITNENVLQILQCIKIVKKYDPFNLEFLKSLYSMLQANDIVKEFEKLQNVLEFKTVHFQNPTTRELQCELAIIDAHVQYQTARSNFSIYLLELYELFLVAYQNNDNYIVLRLGLYLFPQLNNMSLINKRDDIYLKLLAVIKSVEGNASKSYIKKSTFLLSALSTSILNPTEIIYKYPEYYQSNIAKATITEYYADLYTHLCYSNILGSCVVNKQINNLTHTIYTSFLSLYQNTDIITDSFKSSKILNNLAIYELENKLSNKIFTELLYQHAQQNIKNNIVQNQADLIIINNLIFYLSDELDRKKIYENIQKKSFPKARQLLSILL